MSTAAKVAPLWPFKRVLNDHLIVQIDEFRYSGKIVIPDTAKHKPTKGIVIAIADNIKDIEIGDKILFSQFAGYYANPKVDATLKTNTISRIKDYYNNTIRPHKVHDRVFRFWVHRTITTKLAEDINNALSLVNPADDIKKSRQFPCDDVKKATFPAPP